MKKKIIHVLCHTVLYNTREITQYTWSAKTARFLNKYSKDYKYECYFATLGIKKERSWIEDGIKYRLFPCWTLNKGLESFFGIVLSSDLLNALKKELRLNKKTIVHIQGERGFLGWQIIYAARAHPVFLQFHGYRTPKFLKPFEMLSITPLEKYFFRFVRKFFVPIKKWREYLIKIKITHKKIVNLNLGADFDIFKPQNQLAARKKLRLPLNKKIFLYVGRFDRVKGVKKIIDAHLKVKRLYDSMLLLVGGTKDNEYYKYAKKYADLTITRIESDKLISYFAACDAYCMLCPPEKASTSGMGIAPCEALACGKPILSSNLHEAPVAIQNKIGYLVKDEKELEKRMIDIIIQKNKFLKVRSLAKPYYSWEIIVKHILQLYKSV